jgi:FlgD Ig-like domain
MTTRRSSHRSPAPTALLVLRVVLAATAAPAFAGDPSITVALREGDPVSGGGNVTRIDNVAVNNSGQWLVEADTDFANTDLDQVLVNNAGLVLREGDPLPAPAGAQLSSFDSINLNASGDSGWNFFLSGTNGTFDDSGIYFNTILVIQESDTSSAPEFSPNTAYRGFFDAKMTDTNEIVMVCTVDDPLLPTTVDQAIVRLALDDAGNLISEAVLAKEGDVLAGQTELVEFFETDPHGSALNEAGDFLFAADLAGNTVTDGAIYLNAVLIAQEGSPSPVPLRNYELLLNRALGLGNQGSHVFKANLDGATTDDDLIIKDGAVFKREGESFAAIAPFQLENMGLATGPLAVDDNGRVVWFGDWNNPNLDVDTGLFVDETLVVQEGVTTIGGVILDVIANGQDSFSLSDNGRWLLFEGTLLGGIDGSFLVDLGDVSGVADDAGAPTRSRLDLAIVPNPFQGATSIRYTLDGSEEVAVAIYDLTGRLVARLAEGRRPAGTHAFTWDGRTDTGRPLAAGTYFARFTAGDATVVTKLTRAR